MKDLGSDVADVFAGPEIIIHFKKKDAKLNEKALLAVLKKHKVKLKGKVKADASYIL